MDYIIIVAGGKGLRMGTDIPKQFLPIGGKPVLMRTLERFREYSKELQIILVLPKAQQDYWHQLCEEYHFNVEYMLADGGETRFHSVQNGLASFATAIRQPKKRRPLSPLSLLLKLCATLPREQSLAVSTVWCRRRNVLTSSC